MLGQTRGTSPQTMANLVEHYSLTLYIETLRLNFGCGSAHETKSPLQRQKSREFLEAELPDDVKDILLQFFWRYCEPSGKGKNLISQSGFANLLNDLSIQVDDVAALELFKQADKDSSYTIDRDEFFDLTKHLVVDPPRPTLRRPSKRHSEPRVADEDEDDDQEEMPEEFKDLSPEEQRKHILLKSFGMMGLGALLVLIFSDPMVDVLSEIGVRSGIPAFYISFVLAPLASNASELVAAFRYASKKSRKTITISLNTLEGAACMNNTFCLSIFYALVYYQGLAWKFTAETITIFLVQAVIAVIVLLSNQQTLLTGLVILGLFPLTLVFVYCLEEFLGID